MVFRIGFSMQFNYISSNLKIDLVANTVRHFVLLLPQCHGIHCSTCILFNVLAHLTTHFECDISCLKHINQLTKCWIQKQKKNHSLNRVCSFIW